MLLKGKPEHIVMRLYSSNTFPLLVNCLFVPQDHIMSQECTNKWNHVAWED